MKRLWNGLLLVSLLISSVSLAAPMVVVMAESPNQAFINMDVQKNAFVESEPDSPTPALELAYVTEFATEWYDAGSGGDFDGAFYRPDVPAGYHALGHYGQGHYGPARGRPSARRVVRHRCV